MKNVLVVGAGQLGLMMACSAARLGVSVDRIDHVTGEILPGTSQKRLPAAGDDFSTQYDVITAELEHLLGNPLVEKLQERPNWLNPTAMDRLPARDSQKTLLDDIGVATSPWRRINGLNDLESAFETVGEDLVVKTIRDGYDGKGQWVVSAGHPAEFSDEAFGRIIAEKKIAFDREVSIVGARFSDGECYCLPLAENFHDEGMLRYTIAPAVCDKPLEHQARQMFEAVTRELGYTGVLAIECFDVDGQLIVNEIAPRVHNSGHWSQSGSTVSQFDLHLLSITGLSCPPPSVTRPTLMLNLIGCEWNPDWCELPDIQMWWYGKSYRENRKLGHINISADSPHQLIQIAGNLQSSFDTLHQQMLTRALNRLTEIQ
ncbi:MAG: ATP-grasp domain-containing protein [Pseudomonadota bacterium]